MMANRIDEGVTEGIGLREYGSIVDVAMNLLPVFLRLFQSCPAKASAPEPVNTIENPSDDEKKAWSQAWGMKSRSTEGFNPRTCEYRNRLLRTLARAAMRQRKNSGPITKAEAMEIAHESLEEARLTTMPDLAATVLEAMPVAAKLTDPADEVFEE